jgi:FkbM family methyltransferase
VTEPSGQRWIDRLHAVTARAANRVARRNHPIRRALTPMYGRLLHVLAGGRGIACEINGDRFRVDPRFRVGLRADYERQVSTYLHAHVSRGQSVINVGANVGVYVLPLDRMVGTAGRVIAFEPNPATCTVLRRNLRMNGMAERVTVECLAVGAAPGRARLYDPSAGSGFARIGAPHPIFFGAAVPPFVEVPVTSLDEWCGTRGVDPDWLIIDVEGYELEVLRGAAATIARLPRLSIVMELHPNTWNDHARGRAEVSRALQRLGLSATGLTGQSDPIGEYGVVRLSAC